MSFLLLLLLVLPDVRVRFGHRFGGVAAEAREQDAGAALATITTLAVLAHATRASTPYPLGRTRGL